MRLVSLRVHGFKSFANPVSLEFVPGLNVVVGPNGSGKSNIIEALRWVLGDNYREMRVTQNRQVIFHGSPAAHPLGMAFIETSWEDEEKEIFILARRLFANGESEYFYNGRKLKLKEMKEVVFQHGFPGDTMSVNVVDHAKLQTLFDYRPAERYRLFETSSGVYGMKQKLKNLVLRIKRLGDKLDRLSERRHELTLQLKRVKRLAAIEKEVRVLEEEIGVLRYLWLRRSCEAKEEEITSWKENLQEVNRQKNEIGEKRKQKLILIKNIQNKIKNTQVKKEEIEREFTCVKERHRKLEQEIFFFLTEARQQVFSGFSARETLKNMDIKYLSIQKRLQDVQSHPLIAKIPADLEKEERVHMEKLNTLRSVLTERETEREGNHEKITRLESFREQMIRQRKNFIEETKVLIEKITKTEERLKLNLEESVRLAKEYASLKKQLEEGVIRLQRRSLLLARMRDRIRHFERKGRLSSHAQKLLNALKDGEWSGRVVHSLAWLLTEVEILSQPESLQEEDHLKNSGKFFIAASSLPPSSLWNVISKGKILDTFHKGDIPEKNCISPDGGIAYLRTGLLIFPRKILLESRGNIFFRSLEKRIVRWEEQVQKHEVFQDKLTRQQKRLEKELVQCNIEEERLHERLVLLKEEKENIGRKLRDIDESLEKSKDKFIICKKGWDESQRLCKEVKEEIGKVESRLKKVRDERLQLADLSAVKEKILSELHSVDREKRKAEISMRETIAFRSSTQKRLVILREDLLKNKKQHVSLQSKLSNVQAALGRMYKNLDKENDDLHIMEEKSRTISDKSGEFQLAVEKARFQYEELKLRLKELGSSPRPPTDGEKSLKIQELKNRVTAREEEINQKTVRRGAIEEMEELEERERFLAQQIDDFQDIITFIEMLSRDCEKEVLKQFHTFVENVNILFPQNFRKVFGGGSARVVLEGEGLDVEVQIPGKRRQSLSLLSSGEKALTSLCLFLSLFQAGSFRFCFFDEVDANLDHSNSVRFADVLKEFSSQCQVVIVTHQEEVMENASRILGVTMDSPGISRVISLESFSELPGTIS